MTTKYRSQLAFISAIVLATTMCGIGSSASADDADPVAAATQVSAETPPTQDTAPAEAAPAANAPAEELANVKAPSDTAPVESPATPGGKSVAPKAPVAKAVSRLSPTAAAAAATCVPGDRSDAITGIDVATVNGSTTFGAWQKVTVSFTGELPDGGCAGDTIAISLPSELNGFDGTYAVRAADGTVMGTMVVSEGIAVITFNDYVEAHDKITFDGFFSGQTNNTLQPGTEYDLKFDVGAEVFTVPIETGPCGPSCVTPVGADKSANLRVGDPNTVAYQLFAPGTTAAGDAVVFTDTLGPGQKFDCSTVRVHMGTSRDAWGSVIFTQLVTDRAAIVCDPASSSMTVSVMATASGEYYRLSGSSIVTAERDSYADSGTVSVAGKTADVDAVARVADGGVSGDGSTRTPKIDIEKWSTSEGATKGDYDDAPGKPLDATKDESISFTIKNNGTERLVDVVVRDSTTGGTGKLKDASCDFSPLGGPATGLTWAGPFNVNDSFTCTGTLPALGPDAAHQDTATVVGIGMYSGVLVDDKDPWNGTTPPTPDVPATPPTSEVPSTPSTPGAVMPDSDSAKPVEDVKGLLPNTGVGGATLPLGVAGVLLVLFGALLVRRRSTES